MNIFKITSPLADVSGRKINNSGEKLSWHSVPLSNDGSRAKVFDDIKLKQPLLGDIFVCMSKQADEYVNDRFVIEIKNKLGKVFGEEILDIKESNKNISGYFMNVSPEYRRKSFRMGELMRLASIMELLENNGNEIRIYSKDTAIYFHSKYKFKPAIIQFENRTKCLQSVASDKSKGFESLAHRAKALLNQIESAGKTYAEQVKLSQTANQIIKDYIDMALKTDKPEKTHPFNWGMDMVLTKEDILENKDFFNELFKKHGIDYSI